MDFKDIELGLRNLYAGVIYDALYFDLNYKKHFTLSSRIKPISSNNIPCIGYAFTCQGGEVIEEKDIDDDIRLKMFSSFRQNCIQIVSSGGKRNVAQFGDISARLARKFGALGAVIDSPTRDKRFIENLKFPLFCTGTNPKDAYGSWQICEFQSQISMPGIDESVEIFNDDIIFGDADGVLVIPKSLIRQTIEMATKRADNENRIRRTISETNYVDPISLNRSLGRW